MSTAIQKLTSPGEQFGPPLLLVVSQCNEAAGYTTAFQGYVDSYIDISEHLAGPQLGTTNVHICKGRMTGFIAGPQRLHIFIEAGSEFTVTPYAPEPEPVAEYEPESSEGETRQQMHQSQHDMRNYR